MNRLQFFLTASQSQIVRETNDLWRRRPSDEVQICNRRSSYSITRTLTRARLPWARQA